MKVILFGSNGMLGAYLNKYLSDKYDIIPITRSQYDVIKHDFTYLENLLKNYDIDSNTVVINAIGIIPQASKNYDLTDSIYIKVNAIFPNALALICDKYNAKMIHSTTDCVFNGHKGNYIETDKHNVTTIYGTTKSLGEPTNCTVIRTSIIGEELYNKRSLLEWVKSNRDKEINGYANHYWNGITCLQYAKIIDQMITNDLFWKELGIYYHREVYQNMN